MDVQKIDLPIVTPDGTHLDPKKLTKEQWEQIPPEVRAALGLSDLFAERNQAPLANQRELTWDVPHKDREQLQPHNSPHSHPFIYTNVSGWRLPASRSSSAPLKLRSGRSNYGGTSYASSGGSYSGSASNTSSPFPISEAISFVSGAVSNAVSRVFSGGGSNGGSGGGSSVKK